MRHRLIATTLGAIACVIACLTTGVAGGGGGSTASHFTTFASSPPVTGTISVTTTGQCPAGVKVWCNATTVPPVPATASYADELGIVNPAQGAPWPGNYMGSIVDTGGFVTAPVFLGAGGHSASTLWTGSLAWSGLVSVGSGSPCPGLKYSELWLNLTASLGVYTSTGTLVAATAGSTPILFDAVSTATTGCTSHLYFAAGVSTNTPLTLPFTVVAPGNYHLVTTIGVSAVIGYTQDSCAIFGANWGHAGPWFQPTPAFCPPIGTLAAPPLPPPIGNAPFLLASSTIV